MIFLIFAGVSTQALYYVRKHFYYSFRSQLFALSLTQAYLCRPFDSLDLQVLPCYHSLALGTIPISLLHDGPVCLKKERMKFEIQKGVCKYKGLEKQVNLGQDFSFKQAKLIELSERITLLQNQLMSLLKNITKETCWIEDRVVFCKGALQQPFEYHGISIPAERLMKNSQLSITGFRYRTVFQVDQSFQIGLLLLGNQIQISSDRRNIRYAKSEDPLIDWKAQNGKLILIGILSLLPVLISLALMSYYTRRPQMLIGKYQSVINNQIQISTDRSKDEGDMKSMQQIEEYEIQEYDFQNQNSDL